MESIADFLSENQKTVREAWLAFLVFGVLVAVASVYITRAVMGGALEAARERLQKAQEDVARSQGAKDALSERLDAQDKRIAELRNELATRPRIHISPDGPDPKVFKEGEVWLQYDKGKDE